MILYQIVDDTVDDTVPKLIFHAPNIIMLPSKVRLGRAVKSHT